MVLGYIGKGAAYPPQQGITGTLSVEEEVRIVTNLRFLLSLKYGDIPGMEEAGSEFPNIFFDKLDDTKYVEDGVETLIQTLEKRVAVQSFDITLITAVSFKSVLSYNIKGLQVKGDIEILGETNG